MRARGPRTAHTTQRARCLAVVVLAVLVLHERVSLADARAESAAELALNNAAADYGGEHYQRALYRLNIALRACTRNRCSAATQAALQRDLGAIQFRRKLRPAATKAWTKALHLQPDIALNPAYDAPDLRVAWENAQHAAGVAASEEPKRASPEPPPTTPPPGAAPAVPDPEAALGPQEGGACQPKTAECEDRDKSAPAPATALPPVTEEATEPKAARARFWVGVAGALDLVVMPAASNVCKLAPNLSPANSAGYYCTNPDGSDFPSAAQNAHLTIPSGAGRVDTTLVAGDVRVLLALDIAVTDNVLFGTRFGYVLDGYRGTAAVRDGRALGAKIHAEVRGTYVFGADPLSREGFAPAAFVGAGFSEFDAQTSSAVTLDNVVGTQTVRVWITDAPFFVTAGAGVRYQFSPRIQLTLAGRLNVAFGGGFVLPTLGPEGTVQYGF